MKPYVFHPDAARELEEAVAFYEDQREGLGLEFQTEAQQTIEVLRQHPEQFPLVMTTVYRRCRLRRFPYHLFFRDLADHVRIIAVAHQKRKPGYWLNRT